MVDQPPPVGGPTPPPDKDPNLPNLVGPQSWNVKPIKWLGMQFDEDETKKLWSIITQAVGQAIQKESDKAIQAIKKLRKSTDPDQDSSEDS